MPTSKQTCPKCGSENVSEIIYGEVGADYQRYYSHKVIPGGGCITEASPRWHCDACQQEWGRLPPDRPDPNVGPIINSPPGTIGRE